MTSTTTSGSFALRLSAVGLVVFLANFGLLVLQLVAGRLLSPFIGSSLETWTSVIAAFLAGIAVGNAVGARLAARATGVKLSLYLFLGGLGALWMIGLPYLLESQKWHTSVDILPRIPLLSALLCFPAGCLLSIPTPLAIRLGVPDVNKTGLVSGTIFALSTLGCLLGNYLTGFVLIPELSVNQIVLATATLLFVTAAATFGLARKPAESTEAVPHPSIPLPPIGPAALSLPYAYAAVFLCSFAGMTLELSATRVLAPVLGVSIYLWTGVIGVMLAGTCLGNWIGGMIASAPFNNTAERRKITVAVCMVAGGIFTVAALILFSTVTQSEYLRSLKTTIEKVLFLTFTLFFAPMLLLGMISPQIIRLAISDVSQAGATAGRVYAWSTVGAIVGTLATGYFLISTFGMFTTVLIAAIVPTIAACLTANPFKHSAMLYIMSIVLGAILGGSIILYKMKTEITAESNYYTIKVKDTAERSGMFNKWLPIDEDEPVPTGPVDTRMYDWKYKPPFNPGQTALLGGAGGSRQLRMLTLDLLIHSIADLRDPTFLHYEHEQFQLEAVYAARERSPAEQKILVIGGGGYTFPRCARTLIPTSKLDVVEIDPAVTKVAYDHMGLDPKLNINAIHMDGRQFVAEKAKKNSYQMVSLDAVNDLSVPYHLLTKECNDAVKGILTEDGAYLVTVIDDVFDGRLWKATYNTLKLTFPHVEMTFPVTQGFNPDAEKSYRSVIVLYASNKPLDSKAWDEVIRKQTGNPTGVLVVPEAQVKVMLDREKKPIILTDQYSPVDHLMKQVFDSR
jgi:spermidine synthase